MKLYHFVSVSAVVLVGWLTLTFFLDVSPQQYQQQRKGTPTHSASRAPVKPSDSPQTGMSDGAREIAATLDR